MLGLEGGDGLGAVVPGPQVGEGAAVEPAEQVVGRAWRALGSGAGGSDEVDGEVAVVGAAALVGPVDQLHQPPGDLARGAAPAVIGLVREQSGPAAGLVHELGEALLGVLVALGVDHEHTPLRTGGHAVGETQQRLGLPGPWGADYQHGLLEPPERHPDTAAPTRQEPVSVDVAAELEGG